MPDFSKLFINSKGSPIEYKGKKLCMFDDFPVSSGDKVLLTIEKTNSEWKQGCGLSYKGSFEAQGQTFYNKISFWDGESPPQVLITVFPKKGSKAILVKNLWDTGDGVVEAWTWGAAMIIEEIPNDRRYYCNDGHPDENFDDIVFTI